MEALPRKIFKPLPLFFLALALGVGWLSAPVWERASSWQEGLRVCTDRVNFTLLAHTLRLVKSQYLGASFTGGTEECWTEVIGMVSQQAMLSPEVAKQKANELSVQLHELHLALTKPDVTTRMILDKWNPFAQGTDELRAMMATSRDLWLSYVRQMAGLLSGVFFILTLSSLFQSRARRSQVSEVVDGPVLVDEHEVEPSTQTEMLNAMVSENEAPATLEVQTEIVAPIALVAPVHFTQAMQPAPQVQVAEVTMTSDVESSTEVETAEKVEKIEKKTDTVTTMGALIKSLINQKSEEFFAKGILVKTDLAKDFLLHDKVEAFQAGIFYLLTVHLQGDDQVAKTIEVNLREYNGRPLLSIQSYPVKSWKGDNLNLMLAKETMHDVGLEMEWDISFLGAQSSLLTTCRGHDTQSTVAPAKAKLGRLVRGTKSQIQSRLREMNS